ncbi:MAG TPA: hypothetical protein VGD90_00290 [Sphingobacteriaceae bacterium]
MVLQLSAIAQKNSKKDQQFIDWALSNWKSDSWKTKQVLYKDGMEKHQLRWFEGEIFKEDTLRNRVGRLSSEKLKDFLVLTNQEKSQVKRELELMNQQLWPKGLFKNSIMLDRDSLGYLSKPLGYLKYGKKYKTGFYTFSKPIFLRNNTICILFLDYWCSGLCGDTDISVYKKENGRWKKWL